jgi:hypothetical protein
VNRLLSALGVFGLVLVAVIGVLLLQNWLAGGVQLDFASLSSSFNTFTTIFLGIFIEAAPFLLLGTLASGLVEVYFNKESVQPILPSNPFAGALVGGLLGFTFPVCECGVVPLTRRLFIRAWRPLDSGPGDQVWITPADGAYALVVSGDEGYIHSDLQWDPWGQRLLFKRIPLGVSFPDQEVWLWARADNQLEQVLPDGALPVWLP